jgi:hypothetical protein
MPRLLMSAAFVVALVSIASAVDIDRHATYSDPKTPNAAAQCKGFYGTDDNRTACDDWCTQFRSANVGADCQCDDGKCAADEVH